MLNLVGNNSLFSHGSRILTGCATTNLLCRVALNAAVVSSYYTNTTRIKNLTRKGCLIGVTNPAKNLLFFYRFIHLTTFYGSTDCAKIDGKIIPNTGMRWS